MTILRGILAIILGVLIGGLVNMGIVIVGGVVIPPPPGVNSADTESLRASMHLFEVRHFISPFFAHACGTFIGASVATLIAVSHKMKFALAIGLFFMMGGIVAVSLLPAPAWFIILDLTVAYLPMAWLAGVLFREKEQI